LRDQFIILLAESARPTIGTRALTEALLKQCLILLLRRMIQRGAAPLPWMMAVSDDRLARALRAIFKRFAEPFTVETLADIAGMSRSSFAARFTDAFGQTPMSLLRAARLRRARELLLTTDTPVAQIAHDVGFVGRSNFSRAFRKMYSVDPTKFRTSAFGPQSVWTSKLSPDQLAELFLMKPVRGVDCHSDRSPIFDRHRVGMIIDITSESLSPSSGIDILRVTRNRYVQSDVVFSDVLKAQSGLAEADNRFTQALLNVATVQADFEKALGVDQWRGFISAWCSQALSV
jgi:AraC-like DNA-binding protein